MDASDTATGGGAPDLDLGFTLGLDLPFEETVAWAGEAGFDFVELLLDGPYARERIAGDAPAMRETLADGCGVSRPSPSRCRFACCRRRRSTGSPTRRCP